MQFGSMPGQRTTECGSYKKNIIQKESFFTFPLGICKGHLTESLVKVLWWSMSDSFNVKVGLHQGSVLSLLLFIIVLETLPYAVNSTPTGSVKVEHSPTEREVVSSNHS